MPPAKGTHPRRRALATPHARICTALPAQVGILRHAIARKPCFLSPSGLVWIYPASNDNPLMHGPLRVVPPDEQELHLLIEHMMLTGSAKCLVGRYAV